MRRILRCFALLLLTIQAHAGSLGDIRAALERAATSKVQEKVFLHTDNQCYFVGDTLWYKAYVVRADSLIPTNLSRILYVELLSPDGLVVERQNIVVSPKGYTCGQFVLQDSLYSGYYELRAYTRWMLNFNVRHHRYRTQETWSFYNKAMAADYFRIWDGLYSRVLPIYSKPEEPGDYDARRMYQRPKTRIPKPKKENLVATFYPEGGHLIEGVPCRVAFNLSDQNGEAVNLNGTVSVDGQQPLTVKTEHMGRGSFVITPGKSRPEAHFTWRGNRYSFDLPKPEKKGVALQLRGDTLLLTSRDLPADRHYGLSILCRGTMKHFEELELTSPFVSNPLTLHLPPLTHSGVYDLTIFDDEGQVLADRLFFVNGHEHDDALVTTAWVGDSTLAPYQQTQLTVQCEGINSPTPISLSIRDTRTDEPTYNDGNLMTDLLLSSELRGFIAHPAHYFEKDDAEHRQHLDLLMMVQGWRKYNWHELADTAHHLRYAPETGLTVEGTVYKMLSINDVELEEVSSWENGVGLTGRKKEDTSEIEDPFTSESSEEEGEENPFFVPVTTIGQQDTDASGAFNMTDNANNDDPYANEYGLLADANAALGVNHGNLRREVLVEAELSIGTDFVASTQKTTGGHFIFHVPPFYGDGFLNMKAYKQNDSIKKNMLSRKDKYVLDENAFADFYVKRDIFFPVYAHEYNFYEKHQPDIDESLLIDTLSELSMENDVHQLADISVKGRRRGRRATDWNKPAYVVDAYELYNEITDRGLSYGKFDMRQFPVQAAKLLYGNMNRYKMFNVDGRLEGYTYYRNYSDLTTGSVAEQLGKRFKNRSAGYIFERLKLKRLDNIRFYTDFEPRSEDSTIVAGEHVADVTVEMVPIADEGKQITYRDRHIVFHGFSYPEEFYQPDYSGQLPAEPTDYRRTLYWNPNAMTDGRGRFTATFYNNSKETRIKISAAGITSDGRLLHSK